MLVLAIDTSGITGSLAVAKDSELLGVISTSSAEAYSSRLFRQLEFLLEELRLGLPQFDLFAVSAGPGSFTGLRVGLAAVKGWAEVYERPVAAVSALEAIAYESRSTSSLIAAVADGRRGQVFGALYSADSHPMRALIAPCVLAAGEFLAEVARLLPGAPTSRLTIASPVPEMIRPALAEANLDAAVAAASPVLAPAIAQIGAARAAAGDLTTSLELDANYIRRSDAEVLWKPQ